MRLPKSKMHNEQQYEKARKIAYRLLTYRDRTESEISRKLEAKGFESDIICKVIEHLLEYGFVNDQDYVKRFIARNQFRSKAKIWVKLRDLGVSSSLIESALDDAGPEFEFQAALSLILKKINRSPKSMKEVVSYLKNRGFSHSTVERVCNYLETSQDVDNLDS